MNERMPTPGELDPILSSWLEIAEKLDGDLFPMTITIVAGSVVVRGYLISESSYVRRVGDRFAEVLERGSLRQGFLLRESYAEVAEQIADEDGGPSPGQPRMFTFVHLLATHMALGANELSAVSESLWRIPIAHVAAYSLGDSQS